LGIAAAIFLAAAPGRRGPDAGAPGQKIEAQEPQPDAMLALARESRARMEAALRDGLQEEAAAAAQACADETRGADAGQSAAPDGGVAPGVEAAYLEAVCSIAQLRLRGFTPLAERRVELLAALSRVAAVAPGFDGAGGERELGWLLAALPAGAGGDMTLARRHLEAAIRIAPQEPRNHLVLARAVAVKAQDRALFESEIRKVAADPATAQEASALLAVEDDLFGPAQAAQPTPGGTRR
jgi:hypothetical protein